MKKLIAIALTFMMVLSMAPVAMASSGYYQIELDNESDLGSDGQLRPGVVYEYKIAGGSSGDGDKLSVDNFRLSVEYNDGKSYVEYVRKQEGRVVVKLKSQAISSTEKDIDIDITLTATRDIYNKKDKDKKDDPIFYKDDTLTYNISETIAQEATEVEPAEDADDAEVYLGDDADTIYYADGTSGYVAFSAGYRDFLLTVKMGRNSKMYINVDTSDIPAVYNAHKNVSNANIDCYTFTNPPTLSGTGVMSVDKQAYVYKWSGSKLTRLKTYMEDGRCKWDVTGKLGSYVVSSKALTADTAIGSDNDSSTDTDTSDTDTSTTSGSTDKNPDTGR